jgi:cell division protein FtsZ
MENSEQNNFPKNLNSNIYIPSLKVIGIGGGGCNAVQRMIEMGMSGVEFIAANTDHQALKINPAKVKIQLGPNVTRGLGAGGDPKIGEKAAEESQNDIADALDGADMVFLTAGMGGGSGTGAIPVVANISREIGAVSMAIVTTPFSFEMGQRQRNATSGLNKLRLHTNTLITIPNDRLLKVAPRHLPIETAFILADDVLRQSVQGITELITRPGLINVDFAHIRRLIQCGGGSLMSIGHGKGENKAQKALEQALHHPLLEEISLFHSAGIIANFTGSDSLALSEVNDALNYLHEQSGADTEIVLGVNNDENMGDRVQLILVITGLGAPTLEEALSNVQAQRIEHQTAPILEPREPVPEISSSFQDLDLPAFLRRRSQQAG